MPNLPGVELPKSTALPGGYQVIPTESQEGSSSTSKSKTEYDPELLKDLKTQLSAQVAALNRESPYAKLIGKDDELSLMDMAEWEKEAARQQYLKEMDSNRKGELWDRVIRSLGQIGAGAYGLHSGLDVAKYYKPEAGFDRAKEDQAAKERLAVATESAEAPVNTAKTLADLQEKINKTQGEERERLVRSYMDVLNMTGEKQGLQEQISKSLGMQTLAPAAAGRGQGNGKKNDEWSDRPNESLFETQKLVANRRRTLNSIRQAPLGTRGRDGVLKNLYTMDYSRTAIDNIVAQAEKVETEKQNGKITNWEPVQERALTEIDVMEEWPDATNPESEAFSKWYLGNYYPRVEIYGSLGVPVPSYQKTTTSGRTVDAVNPLMYEHSHYRQWLAKQKNLKGVSPESPKAINTYRNDHGLVNTPKESTPKK
jgi:hypothetical protein